MNTLSVVQISEDDIAGYRLAKKFIDDESYVYLAIIEKADFILS